MAKNLTTCTLAALDELGRIIEAKQILEVCLEQFENPTAETSTRVELFLTLYIAQMEEYLSEMRVQLNWMHTYIKGDSNPDLSSQ